MGVVGVQALEFPSHAGGKGSRSLVSGSSTLWTHGLDFGIFIGLLTFLAVQVS